jgi:hypothetical protein
LNDHDDQRKLVSMLHDVVGYDIRGYELLVVPRASDPDLRA